ncbi:MAG: NAD-dependent epimerase/dehydratase family protein [Desulfotignum sp.]
MKQVLVTGGGGFLGKALVTKLVEREYAVTSFSRHHHKALAQMGVPQILGDLTDAAAVKQAVKGMETVFHVAAKPGIWGPYETYHAVNVTGTEHVMTACVSERVKRLIYTSSPSVVFDECDMENVDESVPYPDSYLAPYPATKAAAEKLVCQAATLGLHVIILRPHLIWGPEDNHLVPGILKRANRLRIVGRTDDRVDTIYVDNAALAHVLAAEKLEENHSLSGNIYFISQDDPVSKWEMANAFLDAAGLPPIKKRVSARTAYAAGWFFEKLYTFLGIAADPPMTRFVARELATSHWFDISRAKRDLGYVPEISTQEGLRRLKGWLSRNS